MKLSGAMVNGLYDQYQFFDELTFGELAFDQLSFEELAFGNLTWRRLIKSHLCAALEPTPSAESIRRCGTCATCRRSGPGGWRWRASCRCAPKRRQRRRTRNAD